jgi:hypothetical protein
VPKHLGGVGLLADGAQVVGRNVVDVERQHLERQRGVPAGVVDLAPALQRGRVDLRIGLGQVQAAVGRQAFEQDFAEMLAAGIAAGGQVQHQFSSSLRMRTIGASTVGKACSSARPRPWCLRACRGSG